MRGSGTGTIGSRERTVAGKEAHWILQSDRSTWKAFVASVQCRAAGSLPGMAVGGGASGWSPSTAHSYLQALQRKTNDSLGTVDLIVVLILNCVNSSSLSGGCSGQKRCRRPWPPAGSVDACVGFSFSCVCCNLSFPRKRNKYSNSSFTKMEFCCKRKMLP